MNKSLGSINSCQQQTSHILHETSESRTIATTLQACYILPIEISSEDSRHGIASLAFPTRLSLSGVAALSTCSS